MPAQELDARPLSVLLVEDNADDALLLQRHLRKAGFAPEIRRVETGPDMRAALFASFPPDIVLADYNLPNFSGPEALKLLRNSGIDVPFIMMSGAMSEETAVASMRAGAQDFVIKQNLARLVPALERELREAQARRSRIAAEQALQASEARFHRLVDAMPIGLLLSDAAGRITYANEAVAALLGYTSAELLDGGINLAALGSELRAFLQEGGTLRADVPVETCVLRKDSTAADVLLGAAYLNPDQPREVRQVAAFLVDRTKQKQSEEVLRRTEKLAVAGRLAASIAHEINNPLAAVTNCLFLVQHTELTEEGRAYLEMAQKELDRVAQITVQTLRFHRQASRAIESDLQELAGTVLALFESRLKQQGITVERQFRAGTSLLAFEGEIRQVIVNLLGNAIDATVSGGRILIRTILATEATLNRKGIALTIADEGTGISPESLKHLFEPFFSTKGITGTGLGLWVSQEIVERHGGTIRVRSRLRHGGQKGGTVFRIFLPLGGVPLPAPDSARHAITTG